MSSLFMFDGFINFYVVFDVACTDTLATASFKSA